MEISQREGLTVALGMSTGGWGKKTTGDRRIGLLKNGEKKKKLDPNTKIQKREYKRKNAANRPMNFRKILKRMDSLRKKNEEREIA